LESGSSIWIADDRATHRHALTLPAGELRGPPVEVLGQIEDLGRFVDAPSDLSLVHLGEAEREAHVVAHGHMGVERVVLKHHRDVPLLGGKVIDDPVPDSHRPGGDLLEAGEHLQRRRLAATRGAHKDHQLAIRNRQVDALDCLRAICVSLGHVFELDLSHRFSLVRRPPPLAHTLCETIFSSPLCTFSAVW
jgi:hypothetical protein